MASLLLNAGYLLLLINLLLLIKGFTRNGKAFQLFCLYIAAMFVIQAVTEILRLRNMENLWVSHFYFIVQFILLSLFYRELLPAMSQKKMISGMLGVIPAAIACSFIADPALLHKFNLFEIGITSCSVIFYNILYFKELLSKKKAFFLINTGLLIYLLGSTLLFLAGNYMASLSSGINTWIWLVNALLYILYQFSVLAECIGILFQKKLLIRSHG
ncbi:hypothetical protein [uncultured Flavobacterium sp.]|uniref:hypothetical protein n=1 Tax=uncultured Flavobacterium sp. TaxID=165435 RepID=UPI0025DC4C09|nr:hypothetical protein [uncultured Flavobacterium sp.]